MDLATIAVSVVTLLAPFVKKGAEQFAGEAGKAVWEKTKELFSKVKSKLSHDTFAAGALDRFRSEPEDYQDVLQKELEKQLAGDAAFAAALDTIVREIERAGSSVTIVQRLKKVKNATAAKVQHMQSGSLDVYQEAEEGENIIGVDIEKLGQGGPEKPDDT